MRNSADMLVIDRIAKGIFHIPGIGRVQSITRPQGTPIEHTSIPFLISMQGTSQQMNQDYMDKVMANMLTQANDMQTSINTMERMQAITVQMAATTHSMVEKMQEHDCRYRANCGTTSRISTTSSVRCATTSTGNRTASTSRSAGRSGRSSTPSTASTR